ncbi:Lamin-B receptor [Liparis tanakae]|uniref:Delta(14)-sterol reductase LBR n=1 Tax=Liparis tanakae TaxID=230148 RepID=A0A4Z2F989_9TELE|nr:Lamin-B receptor [Liparis tanakae]
MGVSRRGRENERYVKLWAPSMKMPPVRYQSGDMVMGRWPGSNLYYEVKVLAFEAQSGLYTVIYKDGTELELKEPDIKNASGFQTRSRSRSRSRSPGRRRSPSRSPARTTRRTSSRTAAAAASVAVADGVASSRRDARLKDSLEIRLSPLKVEMMIQSRKSFFVWGTLSTLVLDVERKPSRSSSRCAPFVSLFISINLPPLFDMQPQTKAAENNGYDKHEKKEEKQKEPSAAAHALRQKCEAAVEAEPEKIQGRYNLRRRKDDGDAKPAEAKPQRPEEKDAKRAAAAPPTTPLDFGGKIGVYFWLLFLPAWVLFLVLQVNLEDPSLTNFPPPLPPPEAFWDARALGLVLLWVSFQVLLYLLPVGKPQALFSVCIQGALWPAGFWAVAASALAVAGALHQGVDLTYIHSHFLQLATASFLVAVLLSVFLYGRSRYAAAEQLALGGSSGNVAYDFFKGRELNPRIKEFDLKFFCEMRPGLIGWCLINFALALAEMKLQGLDAPSYAMILVNLFQLLYVVDGLWNEEAILTTMDLMHDGFGFMLAFGDLVWVPFTYTLQAYYLVSHPHRLSLLAVAAIVTLKLVGFYIFRKSNSEKNAFRRNPSDPKLSHLRTIPTATGKSLLVSGWWGAVRHPNYLGDLLMALAWSLPCGFSHLLPWYYMIYFVILLVHRDARDMSECRRKYGSAWDEYCRTVRYRIIPGLY